MCFVGMEERGRTNHDGSETTPDYRPTPANVSVNRNVPVEPREAEYEDKRRLQWN